MRNTSHTGEVSRTQVMAEVALLGKRILVPLGDYQRYDFVFEDEDGRFFRVQCKTGRLVNGSVVFLTCSIDSRSKTGRTIRRPYTGQIDYFGVYCPQNRKVYLVPVGDVPTNAGTLRIDPPQNGQKTHIRWARDYELSHKVPRPGFLRRREGGVAGLALATPPSELT